MAVSRSNDFAVSLEDLRVAVAFDEDVERDKYLNILFSVYFGHLGLPMHLVM